MTTTTEITTINLDISDLAGEDQAEYDWDAITAAYAQALQDACGIASVVVCRNGQVICDVGDADAARDLDWREISEKIDGDALLSANVS